MKFSGNQEKWQEVREKKQQKASRKIKNTKNEKKRCFYTKSLAKTFLRIPSFWILAIKKKIWSKNSTCKNPKKIGVLDHIGQVFSMFWTIAILWSQLSPAILFSCFNHWSSGFCVVSNWFCSALRHWVLNGIRLIIEASVQFHPCLWMQNICVNDIQVVFHWFLIQLMFFLHSV